jgi:hypothetical protein
MKRSIKRPLGRAVPPSTLPPKLTDDTLLSRPETALWLSDNGAPVSGQRLAILATTGAGPPYCVVFGKARYRVADLKVWLAGLTSVTYTSAAARLEHQRRARQERPHLPKQTSPPPDGSGSSPSTDEPDIEGVT